jgi:hypothetical protein
MTCLALAASAATPGCSGSSGSPVVAAQVRADTLAAVARRIYHQEADGAVGHAAVKRISHDRALLAALSHGSPATLRAAALRQLFDPGKHVVRLDVVRAGRTLTDVGGAFVVAPASIELRDGHGRDLGRLDASMQDVIGYVKLVHRLTGAQIVVRGDGSHVASSLAGGAAARLPPAGDAAVGGRTYVVRSFPETGFAGEPLTVWLLTR